MKIKCEFSPLNKRNSHLLTVSLCKKFLGIMLCAGFFLMIGFLTPSGVFAKSGSETDCERMEAADTNFPEGRVWELAQYPKYAWWIITLEPKRGVSQKAISIRRPIEAGSNQRRYVSQELTICETEDRTYFWGDLPVDVDTKEKGRSFGYFSEDFIFSEKHLGGLVAEVVDDEKRTRVSRQTRRELPRELVDKFKKAKKIYASDFFAKPDAMTYCEERRYTDTKLKEGGVRKLELRQGGNTYEFFILTLAPKKGASQGALAVLRHYEAAAKRTRYISQNFIVCQRGETTFFFGFSPMDVDTKEEGASFNYVADNFLFNEKEFSRRAKLSDDAGNEVFLTSTILKEIPDEMVEKFKKGRELYDRWLSKMSK